MNEEQRKILDGTIHKLHIAIRLQRQRLEKMHRHLKPEELSQYISMYGESKRLFLAALRQKNELLLDAIEDQSPSTSPPPEKRQKIHANWPVCLEGTPIVEKELAYPSWPHMDGRVQVFMDNFGLLLEELEKRVDERQRAQNMNRLKRLFFPSSRV